MNYVKFKAGDNWDKLLHKVFNEHVGVQNKVQFQKSRKYLKLLGVKKIKYIGNLKFTQTEKDVSELNKNLKKFFLTKKIWCASSTHQSEEKICLEVHKRLKLKYKNLFLMPALEDDRTGLVFGYQYEFKLN